MPRASQRVAIAGLGAIGGEVARRLARGMPGIELTAVAARDRAKARRTLAAAGIADVPVVSVADLAPLADIVVECAPRAVFAAIAEPVLAAGKELVVLSAGALLEHPGLIGLAERTGGRITVATGALLGLDVVAAAAEEGIDSLKITTRKPPAGLAGAPGLERAGLTLDGLEEPIRVFAGSAAEAAADFPANLNIAVALALAGPGPERTRVELWADPTLTRNTHDIELESAVASVRMRIVNVPSENPRTGRIAPLSVVALLRKRSAPLAVGS